MSEVRASAEAEAEARRWVRLARRVVEHHLGSPAARVRRQTGGLSNVVFGVQHEAGDFIVRIAPDRTKLDVFRKERFASEKAHAAGVPTAEVLFVGDDAIPLPYMVQRRVRGAVATHHPNRLQILRDLGRYGALINSIPTAGFGCTFDWLPEAPRLRATWQEFLRDELGLERRLQSLVQHRMLGGEKVERLRAVLESADQGAGAAMLSHGDLRLKNVLVDEEGRIAAIIDWEDCLSSLAPFWEWSIALHDLAIDEMQAFLEGYGASLERIQELAPVVKALNIVNYVPEIERLAAAGEREPLRWIRMRLSGALDLYSL